MKLTHLSTVSALALVLALGAPATAQVTTDQPADEPTLGTTQPGDGATVQPGDDPTVQPGDDATVGEAMPPVTDTPTADATTDAPATTAQDIGTERLSIAELDELMEKIGIEDSELFAGQVVVTRTEDGHPAIMLFGAQDFEHGEIADMDLERFGDLQDQLTEAGFDDVRRDDAWQLLQGTLNGHHVLVASGDPTWGVDVAARDDDVAERVIGETDADMAQPGVDTAQPGVDTAQPGMDQRDDQTVLMDDDTIQPGVDTAQPDITQPGLDTAQPDAVQPGDDLAERDIREDAEFGIGEPARDFDRERFDETIDEAGFIEDRGEFQGKLVRARTEDGHSIKMLIGREGFAADEEIELSEDDLRDRLEDAGLTDVQVVEDNIAMSRGSYDDMSVLIIAGQGFADDRTQVGAAQRTMPETGEAGSADQQD